MEWSLVVIAVALLGVAAVSSRLYGTPVTPAMVFVVVGVLLGSKGIGLVTGAKDGGAVRTLAEATLALVLFSDASRIKLSALRKQASVPVRLLSIGLPLTIALGALGAALFRNLTIWEAVILAVLLAPTDAALGQAVVTEPRLPSRIRQGLNVESGLNDGICVPLLFIALAAADVESHVATSHHAITIVLEEIGYGLLGGFVAGAVAAGVVLICGGRKWIAEQWLQIIPIATAILAYSFAAALHGSGFIAAFVAGAVFSGVLRRDPEEMTKLTEDLGGLLNGITFLLFGAILLGPALGDITWRVGLYAVLSLTLIRMLPVAIAMLGTHARMPTVSFVGWFGPRGLASIVFALIVVQESHLPGTHTIVTVTYITVGLSVLLHGLSASPLADRYARWYHAHPDDQRPVMEAAPVEHHRARGPSSPAVPGT